MELQLKNIGMIKEANVKLDGLTVIAGENDTGKSTVGKALYLHLKSIEFFDESHFIEDLFHEQISNQGLISLSTDKYIWSNEVKDNKFEGQIKVESLQHNNGSSLIIGSNYERHLNPKLRAIVIETPVVLNLIKLSYQVSQAEKRINTKMDFPELMYDLIFYLENKQQERTHFNKEVYINQKTASIIQGQFQRNANGELFFNRHDKPIKVINTATGAKYFGILQLLSENGWLNEKVILVLDEPEVHLHPKWQLKMAELIVQLVKDGVKILVNSHSPYMIEALERYGEKEGISQDFYLAEDGFIHKINDNNSATLSKIFEKLSAPYKTFDEMDSEILRGG